MKISLAWKPYGEVESLEIDRYWYAYQRQKGESSRAGKAEVGWQQTQ